MIGWLDPPNQRLLEPVAELQVVAGVDDAVAVEIEECFVGERVVARVGTAAVIVLAASAFGGRWQAACVVCGSPSQPRQ